MEDEIKVKVRHLSQAVPKMWSKYFTEISLHSYIPPQKDAGARFLKIRPDDFSLMVKQNTQIFIECGIVFMLLKKTFIQLILTRPVYKKYTQILTDIFDAIDIYDFNSPLRNNEGTRRMDFAHEIAEHLHAKGCKQKKDIQLLRDYQAVLDNPRGKSPEIMAIATFIVKLMKDTKKITS